MCSDLTSMGPVSRVSGYCCSPIHSSSADRITHCQSLRAVCSLRSHHITPEHTKNQILVSSDTRAAFMLQNSLRSNSKLGCCSHPAPPSFLQPLSSEHFSTHCLCPNPYRRLCFWEPALEYLPLQNLSSAEFSPQP